MSLKVASGPVLRAIINAAVGDNELVAAAGAGQIIRVLSYVMVGFGTTNDVMALFEGNNATALTGIMAVYDGTGTVGQTIVAPHNPYGWFDTAANVNLNLAVAGTGGEVDGHLTYQIIDVDS